MRRFHRALQTILRDMGVNLRSRNVGMTQHGLDAAQIRAAFDKMGRECMPQDMRRETFGIDAGAHGKLFQQLMTAAARKMAGDAARWE